MSETVPDIDPELFEIGRATEFGAVVMASVTEFVDSSETVITYLKENAPETLEANRKRLEQHSTEAKEMLDDLSDSLGAEFTNMLVSRIGGGNDAPSDQQFERAYEARQRSATMVYAYTFGYQSFMYERMLYLYDDEAEAGAEAWGMAWNKLRDMVRPLGGTFLAETADMFDALVRHKYEQTYDHTDVLRGPDVRADAAARSFYEVMEPHLTRSIVRRKDEWSE